MNSDKIASLYYLIILLIFIGGYFLYKNHNKLGQSIQQAVIWGLIFLGVIVAYGFKDTISRQISPSTGIVNGASISFKKANDGHFHAKLIINGKHIVFLIDTGASNLVLSKSDAKKVGIDVDNLAFLDQAYTANGVTGIARVRLRKVIMGPFENTNIQASVNEGKLDTSLLGMDYLSRFGRIVIDGDTLTLTR